MNWELIWKAVFLLFASLFAVMSVLVTYLGARDVKRLLQGLKDSPDDE
jgi:hypothetical protein